MSSRNKTQYPNWWTKWERSGAIGDVDTARVKANMAIIQTLRAKGVNVITGPTTETDPKRIAERSERILGDLISRPMSIYLHHTDLRGKLLFSDGTKKLAINRGYRGLDTYSFDLKVYRVKIADKEYDNIYLVEADTARANALYDSTLPMGGFGSCSFEDMAGGAERAVARWLATAPFGGDIHIDRVTSHTPILQVVMYKDPSKKYEPKKLDVHETKVFEASKKILRMELN